MEGGEPFDYRTRSNLDRVEQGQRAVEDLHPDGLNFVIAATLLVADVLHACNAAPDVSAEVVYRQAWASYQVDLQSEPR